MRLRTIPQQDVSWMIGFCNFVPVFRAGVAELADAPDLGSGGVILGGSSPSMRTFSLQCSPFPGIILIMDLITLTL